MQFYVFTEQELQDLLLAQREKCAEAASISDFDPITIASAEEPELPNMLDEWQVVNKITNKEK